ncbi:RagB/SusD family nutrient uptake outer membrane protein [Ancylomarina sp. YFZ004]
MINNIKILILVLCVFSLSSCDDFFDTVPDSRIELDDLNDIAEVLTNAYPAGSYLFLEGMTDNVGAVPSNMQLTQMEEAFNWETISIEGQDTPTYYWSNAYNAIAHANQALKSLETIEGDENHKNAIKGEALLCRAYAHFMLVNIFAKHYDETTAGSDLGVPYIKDPEMILLVDYKRETVDMTYQYIEEDMLEGMALVSNEYYKNSGKYHFTREAAIAFASRLYLYKADYSQCLHYSRQLLGDTYNASYIKNYQEVLAGQGPKGRAQVFSSPDDQSNLMIIRKKLGYQLYFMFGYRMTQGISGSLYIGDARSNNMWAAGSDQSAVYQSKFEPLVKRASLTSSSGLPYTVQPVFRGEEVFFNQLESRFALASRETSRAEQIAMDYDIKVALNLFLLNRYNRPADNAAITSDDTNFTDVVINYYRQTYTTAFPDFTRDTRYKETLSNGNPNPSYDAVVAAEIDEKIYEQNRILLYVVFADERRREFAEEGLRWFDIKRLKLEVAHTNLAGDKKILTADDARKVIQIPQAAIANGIEENEIDVPTEVEAKLIRIKSQL